MHSTNSALVIVRGLESIKFATCVFFPSFCNGYFYRMHKTIGLFLILAFISCKKVDEPPLTDDEVLAAYLNLPANPFNYANPPLPAHLLQSQSLNIDNTPAHNPVTDDGATLGRVLFYDKNLSKNGTIACASCHKQEFAFEDPNSFSEGFEGFFTKRHSMSIINAKYYAEGKFFWDERAATLEDQVLMPIQDSVEMGLTLTELVARIKSRPFYSILFKRAFNSEEITTEKTALALAQFVRSVVSYRTKYDAARAMVSSQFVPFPSFTEEENRGKQLFMVGEDGMRCLVCHGGETFSSPGIRNNGLEAVSVDLGVGGITQNSYDMGMFKTPSLRSILLRPPYMHDGRFATIEAVVEHYNSGLQPHPNLDHDLTDQATGLPKKFNLSAADKQALVAFLATLTDTELATDEKYSNPFK